MMWTIYKHPTDYPDHYVARLFNVDHTGSHPTIELMVSADLKELRSVLTGYGMVAMARSPEDEPQIVETWL